MKRMSRIGLFGSLPILLLLAAIYLSGCGGGGGDGGPPPTFSISGTVMSPDNLDGTIRVCISPDNTFDACTDAQNNWSTSGNVKIVAEDGSYSFSGLQNGSTHYIGAHMDVNGNNRPDVPGEPIGLYGAAVYNDTFNATPVTVSGSSVSGVNCSLLLSPYDTYAIGGTVTYSGAATGTKLVCASTTRTFDICNGRTAADATDGSFTLTDLPNGDYYVGAVIDVNGNTETDLMSEPTGTFGGSRYYDLDNAAAVTINSSDATGNDFTLYDPSIRVRVVNENDDSRVANAAVVLGNSSGAFISQATTDANGEVIFTGPPDDATITAAVAVPDTWRPTTKTSHALGVMYNVNVPAVTLELDVDQELINGFWVNVTNSVSGVVGWLVYPGWNEVMTDVRVWRPLLPEDVQSDGLVSIVVIGVDVTGSPIGYGTLLDQDVASVAGQDVSVTINKTDLANITTTLNNTSASAQAFIGGLESSRKGAAGAEVLMQFAPPPASYTLGRVPDHGDFFRMTNGVIIEQVGNVIEAAYVLFTESKNAASRTVDMNPSLYPTIPSNRMITDGGTARPTLSWTGSAPSADQVQISFEYETGDPSIDGVEYHYRIIAPPSRTSVQFPELPAPSLDAFTPKWLMSNTYEVFNIDVDLATGYTDILTLRDWMLGNVIVEPDEMNIRGSASGIR